MRGGRTAVEQWAETPPRIIRVHTSSVLGSSARDRRFDLLGPSENPGRGPSEASGFHFQRLSGLILSWDTYDSCPRSVTPEAAGGLGMEIH
jgi:hypothetical protein